MFGDAYFHKRADFTDLVDRVTCLAKETGTEVSDKLQDVRGYMTSPYLFLAYGEHEAEKALLLNSLLETDVFNETKKASIRWFKYGEKNKDKKITPHLSECYRSEDVFKRVHLMEASGRGSVNDEQQKTLVHFLPSSDLILWIISTRNPWSGGFWDFMASQDSRVLKKSLIILHQTDVSTENELKVTLGHVKDLAKQRLSNVPPVVSVSAEDVSFLKKNISEILENSLERVKKITESCTEVTNVLRSIEASIEKSSTHLHGNEAFLSELESEVEKARKNHASQFDLKFADMREIFSGTNKKSQRYVRRKLGFIGTLKSLFAAEDTGEVIENRLLESVKQSAEKQAEIDGAILVEDCKNHWEGVMPRVKERLTIQLEPFEKEKQSFDSLRKEFRTCMGRSAGRSLLNLRIRKELSPVTSHRAENLKVWIYIVLFFIILAGVSGCFQMPLYPHFPLGVLVFSAIPLILFAVRVRKTRKQITRALSLRLDQQRMAFSKALEEDYQNGMRKFFQEYGGMLSGVRKHILKAQKQLKPNFQQKNQLFLELMIFERELKS